MTIVAMLAAAVATATAPAVSAKPASPDAAQFNACVALAERDPPRAIATAQAWRAQPVLAAQCLGLAHVRQRDWNAARLAFEAGARAADSTRDGRAASLRVQAANAALASGDAASAIVLLDAALASGLSGQAAGEAHLDRARARAATGDNTGARGDLDAALKLVPDDGFGWLLSATLARRTGDRDRAEHDIAEALARDPRDAAVAYEAGNIALLGDAPAAARTAWQATITLAPGSDAARAAAVALKRLPPR